MKGAACIMQSTLRTLLVMAIIITIAYFSFSILTTGHTANVEVHDKGSSPYVPSGNGRQEKVAVVLTWYGFNDNSGQTEQQYSAAVIRFPRNDGNPTLHNLATEGKGTFKDPITFAVRDNDHRTFPVGDVIYVPLTQKYYIMEDLCGDTDQQGCLNGAHHVDLWMGPPHTSNDTALTNCADKGTPGNTVQVIINPSPSLPVDTTPEFQHDKCTLHTH
jgi:hypothetical protein